MGADQQPMRSDWTVRGHVPMNDNPELVAHVLLTGSDLQSAVD